MKLKKFYFESRSFFNLILLSLVGAYPLQAQASVTAEEVTEHIRLVVGSYHPLHTLAGKAHNPYTGNWINIDEILSSYRTLTNLDQRRQYTLGLSGEEKRALYLALEGEELEGLKEVFEPRAYSSNEGYTSTTALEAYRQDRDNLQAMLDAMSGEELVGVLNQMNGLPGPVYLGAHDVYGEATWGTLEGIDLSNRDLTGLDTQGKFFYGTNLVGSNITKEQLELADWVSWFPGIGVGTKTNLSGLDLSQVNMTGWKLGGTNLANTGVTAQQLSTTVGGFDDSDLSGNNLAGLDLGLIDPVWISVDLRNTGLTGTDLDKIQAIHNVNLSGLDLRGWNHDNRSLAGLVMDNATVPIELLTGAASLKNLSLKNTGITKATLDAALVAAGKDPNGVITEYQSWNLETGYFMVYPDPPLPGPFNTSTIIFQ